MHGQAGAANDDEPGEVIHVERCEHGVVLGRNDLVRSLAEVGIGVQDKVGRGRGSAEITQSSGNTDSLHVYVYCA